MTTTTKSRFDVRDPRQHILSNIQPATINGTPYSRLARFIFDMSWHDTLLHKFDVVVFGLRDDAVRQVVVVDGFPANSLSTKTIVPYAELSLQQDSSNIPSAYRYSIPIPYSLYVAMLQLYGWGDTQILNVVCSQRTGLDIVVLGSYGQVKELKEAMLLPLNKDGYKLLP